MAELARRASLLLTAAASLLLLLPVHAVAGKSIGIDQGVFEASLPPGSTLEGVFNATNTGDEPLGKVFVYAADIVYDSEGNADYPPVSKGSQVGRGTLGSWTELHLPADTRSEFNVPYISLEPGDSIPISFTVRIPEGASPGDYGAAVFLEMSSSGGTDGSGSSVSGRIGSRLRVRVVGDVIQEFSHGIRDLPSITFTGMVPVITYVDNEGNVDVKGSRIVRLDGVEVPWGDDADTTLYAPPATEIERMYVAEIGGLVPGRHEIVSSVTYYDETIKKDRTLEESASMLYVPWQLILAAAVLLASAVRWRYVSARASRGPRAPERA